MTARRGWPGASSTALPERGRPGRLGGRSRRDEASARHLHGLYWLTANLAARGPLVLAVDDAHWADAPSLRWLSHLAARIDGLPILLLLGRAQRPRSA